MSASAAPLSPAVAGSTAAATLRPAGFGQWDRLPDLGTYDVVVAGGGTAGSVAAIRAARLGLRTLVAEPLAGLGGTSVAALVTPWMGNHVDMGPLNEGLNGELQRDLEASGMARGYSINTLALGALLERKALDAGVKLLYGATIVGVHGVEQADGAFAIDGLVVATREGLWRIGAGVVIDATGDAEVAHRAGVPCAEGRETDRAHQPMSLRFILGGFDLLKVEAFLKAHANDPHLCRPNGLLNHGQITPYFAALAEAEGWPADWLKTFSIQFFEVPGRPNELWFNCPRLTGFDPFDPFALSAAYVLGRRMIDAYLQLWRNRIDGAQDAYLVQVAPLIGIREGRRIVGQYTLTGDDFMQRRKFADGVCLNRYPIDIHNPHGRGVTWVEMPANEWCEIPYRCLVPQGARRLLVAGRCLSSDFTAQASYRITPNCRTLGEAAAVACHLAHTQGIDVSAVDGIAVRAYMLAHGLLPAWLKE